MVYLVILSVVILFGLIVATITDLKTREVPDWVSYGLIGIGLGLNLLFSLVYWNYWFFVNSLAGFLVFFILALIMFYSAQWGGGDSKVLMGLGALIGLDIRFTGFPFLVSFIINILLVGAVYGIIWSFVLAFRNFKSFYKEFRKIQRSVKVVRLRVYVVVFVLLMLVLSFLNRGTIFLSLFLSLLLIGLVTFYLWIFVKAIEKTCMIKAVKPSKLTEGDWIVEDVKVNGKRICGPKDLGIEKKQISKLVGFYKRGKVKKILIKEGIPFVPSFLIAYVLTLFFGNLLFLLI